MDGLSMGGAYDRIQKIDNQVTYAAQDRKGNLRLIRVRTYMNRSIAALFATVNVLTVVSGAPVTALRRPYPRVVGL